jgi:hypothetical protein
MEISEVRRRLIHRMDQARREGVAQREAVGAAREDFDRFLAHVATPVFRQVHGALKAERLRFTLSTPAGSVQLSLDGAPDDAISVELDTASRPPSVIGRATFTRGRRVESVERPLRAVVAVAELTDEDVLEFVLSQIGPFVER